jgi:hypothetical protein
VEEITRGKKYDSPVFDVEDDTPSTNNQARWPSGHKIPKQDVKQVVLTLALQETLKVLIANKDVSFANLGERRHQDKEEQMKTFL